MVGLANGVRCADLPPPTQWHCVDNNYQLLSGKLLFHPPGAMHRRTVVYSYALPRSLGLRRGLEEREREIIVILRYEY